MREVLLPIHPKWCLEIASGRKTIEVRKTAPKTNGEPFKCYIYCTKSKWEHLVQMPDKSYRIYNGEEYGAYNKDLNFTGEANGFVIGEFVCNEIYEFHYNQGGFLIKDDISTTNDALTQSRLDNAEFRKYAGEKSVYGWHISNLVVYDEPKTLDEFYHYCGDIPNCDSCPYFYHENTESAGIEEYCCSSIQGYKPIKRAPQSWCYAKADFS